MNPWLGLKRILLIVMGAITTLLGVGAAISAVFGYYGNHVGTSVAIGVCGALLLALGLFIIWIGAQGSAHEVSDTDLI